MASLAECLKLYGDLFTPEEIKVLRTESRSLALKGKIPPEQATARTVEAHRDEMRAEYDKIEKVIKKHIKIEKAAPPEKVVPEKKILPVAEVPVEKPKIVPEVKPAIIPKEIKPKEPVVEKPIPKEIKIPEFKNTEGALAFGKTATPEQVEGLKAKRDESLSKSNALKAKGDLQGAMDEAVRGQFFREAIESAKGKIVEPKKVEKPVAKIPEEKPLHEMPLTEAIKYENTDLFLSPELRQLHDHKARTLGFEKAGGSFVEGYLKKLAEVAEKTDMPAAMAVYEALDAYKKGNVTQATLDAEKVLGKIHEEEVKVLTSDKISEIHKEHIQKVLKSGELTPKKYAELHEKDYGPLEEFYAEFERPTITPKDMPIFPKNDYDNEIKALNQYLVEHDPKKGKVPARKPYLKTRDEEFAKIVGDIDTQVSNVADGVEDVRHAIWIGEKLGYRPDDIARYLEKNYVEGVPDAGKIIPQIEKPKPEVVVEVEKEPLPSQKLALEVERVFREEPEKDLDKFTAWILKHDYEIIDQASDLLMDRGMSGKIPDKERIKIIFHARWLKRQALKIKEPLSETKARLLENIKSEKGSSELINDLSRLGADAMKRGHTTYKAFTAEMKSVLGDAWTKIKHLMQKAYFAAKQVLKSERGAVEIGKPKPEVGREIITADGTTVDWGKSKIVTKEKVRNIYYATYKKDGSFKKWVTRAEIDKIKALGKVKEKFDVRVEKIKTAKEILKRRREKIKAIKEHFLLSDSDLRKITKKDIRLMSNFEFKQFIDDIRIKAEKFAEKRQAMNELVIQIQEKELNVENLRKAMKLPTLKNMTVENIHDLNEALTPFQKGDVFLSLRKLETVDRTELKGIKTWREARERLAKKLGVSVERLQSIKVTEFDRFRYDTGLAERNPFYGMMVEETAKRMLISEAEYLQMEKDVFALAKELRPRGIVGRLIPQQKKIRAFMEAPADQKPDIELTDEELALIQYMTEHFARARKYLVQIEAMNMGKQNYFTHVRRGPLEAIKEDGIIRAVKEMFEMYKLDEQGFNILDRSTGEILALDKFFKFAMHRVGKIKPTENVVRAFLIYMRTFKKKQALDEIVPLIDIYAHSLTPKGLTKKGLFLDANLIKFTREWLNTQKGRHITLIAKQNGKMDAALRAIKMFTSLRDLGLNIPVSVATEIGEQITTYQLLGKKSFALGKVRQNTKQGKAIIEKYRSLIGKNPWAELVEPSKEIGDRLMEGIFVLFRDASVRSNKTFLLGSLSKEEFNSGEISLDRLAALRTELGRYRMVQGMKSIIGATPEGRAYTQYKRWAIPILRTTIKNFGNLGKKMTFQKIGTEEFNKSVLELYRLVEVTAFVMLMFGMARDEDDQSFAGKMINKAYREATTLIQALQPKMFMAAGRTASFIEELGVNLTLILQGERYKTSDKFKGVEKLKRQITPVAISQFKRKKKPEPKAGRGRLGGDRLEGRLK
jgi:hypothetical protein